MGVAFYAASDTENIEWTMAVASKEYRDDRGGEDMKQ